VQDHVSILILHNYFFLIIKVIQPGCIKSKTIKTQNIERKSAVIKSQRRKIQCICEGLPIFPRHLLTTYACTSLIKVNLTNTVLQLGFLQSDTSWHSKSPSEDLLQSFTGASGVSVQMFHGWF
jgi:hypothetical protein